MKKVWILSTTILMFTASAFCGDVLYVPAKFRYMDGLHVRDSIKNDCALEQFLADDVTDNAHSAYKSVVREKPTSGSYHILDIEITEVFGPGGGSWSGAKNMNIRGTLKDSSGKSLGSFTATRFSTGGVMGGFKGTCGILRRITKALGKDVATFLVAPEEGVRMGN